jgi:hypothetical protein
MAWGMEMRKPLLLASVQWNCSRVFEAPAEEAEEEEAVRLL